MKKTGEILKKARENKGLSIHEIGLSLKINPKILKQIEDGDKDNLPAKTFLRGFVQSYALFLKLDPNEILKTFSEEMGTTKPHQISLTSGPQIRGSSIDVEDPENKDDLGIKRHTGQQFAKEKFEFKNIGIGIVVFILLLSLIAVRKVVEKYQKEAEVDVAKTEENLKSNNKLELPQAPPPVSMPSTVDSKPSTTETTAAVPPPPDLKTGHAATAPTTTTSPSTTNGTIKPTTMPPQPTPTAVTTSPTDSSVQSTPNTNLNSGLPATKPTTTATTSATASPKPTVAAPSPTNTNKPAVTPTSPSATPAPTTAAAGSQKPAAVTPQPAITPTAATDTPTVPPTPPKPKNIELVIEAFETVEIEMTQTSGKTERIKMSPSQVQTFKTVSGVKLNISNGGAVNLIVNGKDIGVPGDLGKPKRVSF